MNDLLEARKQAGLTQEQVAVALGVSAATVSRYETGVVMPPTGMLARLLNVFPSLNVKRLIASARRPKGGESIDASPAE